MSRIAILLLVLTACPASLDEPRIRPLASCGTPCTNTAQCSDIFSSCRYCGSLGKCTSGLIANPVSIDAGVDAAPGDAAP